MLTSLNASKHGWRWQRSQADYLRRMRGMISARGPFFEYQFHILLMNPVQYPEPNQDNGLREAQIPQQEKIKHARKGAHPRQNLVQLLIAMGLDNPPAVRVWTGRMVWFGSRTVQKPDLLLLSRPNAAPYPSTRRSRRVWLDPSGPISGFAFWVLYLWSH